MNYIEQINGFWLLDAEHSFGGNETRLYFYLLKLSNSLYWKNPLSNADRYTATMVGISVNTLKTARNRLSQSGLIQFKPGGNGRRDKCMYWIIPATEVVHKNAGKLSAFDTLSAETLTPNPSPNLQSIDTIYKHIPNQTKQNVSKSHCGAKAPLKEKLDKQALIVHWHKLVNNWICFYKEKFSTAPTFDGAAARHLKSIVQRLEKRAKGDGFQWTEQQAVKSFLHFLIKAYGDPWLKENYLLSNLSSKYDAIVNQSDYGHSKNNQQGSSKISGERLHQAFAAFHSQ